MAKIHPILNAQLLRHSGSAHQPPQDWRAFLDAVTAAYRQADTDRTALEQALAQHAAATAEARTEAAGTAANAFLDATSNTMLHFIQYADPGVVFDSLIETVRLLTHSKFGFIGEVFMGGTDHPSMKVHATANLEWTPDTQAFYDDYEPLTWALTDGRPVLLNDAWQIPDQDRLPSQHPNLTSLAALPVLHGQYAVGIIVLANRPDGYGNDLMRFLQPVLLTCATILEAARNDQRRRLAEDALARARDHAVETARRKDELLAVMSRELRAPLSALNKTTDLLLETAMTPFQQGHMGAVREIGDAVLTIINDILDFAKLEAQAIKLDTAPFDLQTETQDVAARFDQQARRKGLTLTVALEPDVPTALQGDAYRIRQLLTNLVGNAVKFTQQGDVTLRVKKVDAADETAVLLFQVTDTGPGISAEKCSRLFLPFLRTESPAARQYGEIGLGLAICKHLVEMMGGRIGVSSEPGRGSTFWFMIRLKVQPPALLSDTARAASPQAPRVESPPSPRMAEPRVSPRILVVEDSLVIQKVTVKMLDDLGYRADVVSNGAEAVETFSQIPYAAILMDCEMPDLDGFDATKMIRVREEALARLAARAPATPFPARAGRIPILAVTANTAPGTGGKCLAAGMDACLFRPVTIEELDAALKQWIREAEAPDADAPPTQKESPIKAQHPA